MNINNKFLATDECGCGCGHNHEEESEHGMDSVTLTLDDGTEMVCGVVGIFEVKGKEYIALVNDNDEVLLYRYIEDSNEENGATLELFESDEEYDIVSQAFYEIFVEEDDTELGDIE